MMPDERRATSDERRDDGPGGLPEMKVKALAPWFGSKRNLAPVIVKLLPHQCNDVPQAE
ncbi:MAG: hypothetical protein V2A79_09830 [Planctomycetota bacterium]